jgi:hypothetical protein
VSKSHTWSFIGVSAFVLSLTFVAAAGTAMAGMAFGDARYYSANGVAYMSGAAVSTSSGKVSAVVTAGPTSRSVPAGWVGVNSKIFTSTGALKCASGWVYNAAALAKNTGVYAYCDKRLSGTFYADGETRAWTGSGYATYGANRSPNQKA